MSKKAYLPPTIEQNVAGLVNKHGHGNESRARTAVDGVLIADLVEAHGSPLFVFSERNLRDKYQQAYRAFSKRYPKVQFGWSYKTNYLRAICAVFHSEGAIAEVVSDFEYEKARGMGVPGDEIIFNGPYKSEAILRRAVQERSRIQIDNLDELYAIEQIAEETGVTPEIAIRVYMNTGVAPTWSKFGFSYDTGEAQRAIKRIHAGGKLTLVGLHCHVGTFILDPSAYTVAVNALMHLSADAQRDFGYEIQYLNLGGGFASCNTLHYQYLPGEQVTPSFDDYAEAICTPLTAALQPGQTPPLLYLETGRALVDEAGYLVTSVIGLKQKPDGQRAIVVDAGVNLLYTANWYKFDIRPAQDNPGGRMNTTIYGPLCMNIDVIRESCPLPAINLGERLVIHPVGAYNITQAMQFITYRPAVVMVGLDGQVDLIRAQENLAYVEGMEQLPDRFQPKS